ncbi:MAG: protein kinase, partial [Kofleriaceae bacterium]
MTRAPAKEPELAEDSVATVIDRPARPSVADATATSINSPLDALAHAELLRTRRFAWLSFPLAIAGLISLAFLPGERIPTIMMLSAVILAMAGLVYFIYRTRDPSIYKMDFGLTLAWYVTTLAVCSAVPYYGPYTPVSALLVFGVYITSMGQRFKLALAIYLTCAVVQGVTGSLAIFGIADPGFIKGASLSLDVRLICQVLVQVVLLGSFLTARGARQSSLSSLGELERAIRGVAQRQALLEEAREELRRALGTGRGRFTGQQIGRYQLGEVIGRGAMGEVYASVDPAGKPVAVKMLAHASLGNPQHVHRFLRELRTATAIASPNVVRVFEVGEEPLPFLVMERLTGSDLAAMLRAVRVLPHDDVIDLVRQVGAGVAAAGAAGII